MPIAYFITFSTYGTWLHGSSKGDGSVDRSHNEYGTPYIAPDAVRENGEKYRMIHEPFVMSADEREIVRNAIVNLTREKNWRLLALHVRTNHVHSVIQADREAGRLMSDLKSRASRDLTLAGFGNATRRRWTRHGSTKHLFDWASVTEKIDYTLNQQGEPMSLYDGTQPGMTL